MLSVHALDECYVNALKQSGDLHLSDIVLTLDWPAGGGGVDSHSNSPTFHASTLAGRLHSVYAAMQFPEHGCGRLPRHPPQGSFGAPERHFKVGSSDRRVHRRCHGPTEEAGTGRLPQHTAAD